MPELWNIFHQYLDDDGNLADEWVATVSATQEQVDAYRKKWTKMESTEEMMSTDHIVYAKKVTPKTDLENLIPYWEGE